MSRSYLVGHGVREGYVTIRIRLPGGTLKIKKRNELRRREQKREVPVWQVGNYFIVWWPSSMSDRPSGRPPKR